MTEQAARWLLRQAFGLSRRDGDTVLGLLSLTGAPVEAQAQAFRLAKAAFSEGFCPIHEVRLDVAVHGTARRAHCRPCRRWWGKPTEWA